MDFPLRTKRPCLFQVNRQEGTVKVREMGGMKGPVHTHMHLPLSVFPYREEELLGSLITDVGGTS